MLGIHRGKFPHESVARFPFGVTAPAHADCDQRRYYPNRDVSSGNRKKRNCGNEDRCPTDSADYFEYLLVARLVAQWVEVGIVLNPLPDLRTGSSERTFQQIERCVYVA